MSFVTIFRNIYSGIYSPSMHGESGDMEDWYRRKLVYGSGRVPLGKNPNFLRCTGQGAISCTYPEVLQGRCTEVYRKLCPILLQDGSGNVMFFENVQDFSPVL